MGTPGTLHAPLQVEFDYTRSLGPTLTGFMTGLKRRQILGGVLSDGTVAVPPPEYDAVSFDPITELVPVSSDGVVQSWAWVPEPVEGQPLDRPFAFAQIVLDGADRPLLHAVSVDSADQIETGMRVRARWADETVGAITDIRWFEPLDGAPEAPPPAPDGEPVTGIISPVKLAYDFAASPEESAFFRGLAEGKILGQRCPVCEKVYVPPRGACPVDGVPTTTEVEVPDSGIVTTFCIVNVPFLGQRITPPYVSAYMLLDGADIAFLHLLLGVDPADVRMGMRVKAVWKPRDEWGTSIENISHFEPTGEPDADYESFKVHL
ncbi:DNA-binding protein [Aeromicrobium sp. A1-2]|uniref:Zn-ribbon domain-containing OB-fold protein n=1 Tax=Aeromicrobium sp. A1-2 TaxID=2107713 RepID=UPI000E54284E|nr:OB-fold nucleic acid binding domain-containing protein [Aeromicrobium sp. A1-2]AXT84342.1 DNA-binding protein [Aeromicrobium sp. A1-2]